MCNNNCSCKKESLSKEDLLQYSFYDDDGKVIAVIHENVLKKFLDVDKVIFNEIEHK